MRVPRVYRDLRCEAVIETGQYAYRDRHRVASFKSAVDLSCHRRSSTSERYFATANSSAVEKGTPVAKLSGRKICIFDIAVFRQSRSYTWLKNPALAANEEGAWLPSNNPLFSMG